MASGCLMGTCFVCDDLVWEDEWDMVGDRIIHEECKSIAILTDYRDKVDHHHHKRKINEIKEDLENLKHVIKDCEKKIERLEGLIGKDDCMKFYEFNDYGYYALIGAENEEAAVDYYKEVVSDVEEGDGPPDEITKEEAFAKLKFACECKGDCGGSLSSFENNTIGIEPYLVLIDGCLT